MKKMNILFLLMFSSGLFAARGLEQSCIDISFNQEGWNGTSQEYFEYLNSLDLEKDIREWVAKPSIKNPWFRMKVPHIHERALGLFESMRYTHGFYNLQSELPKKAEDWLDKSIQYFSQENLKRLSTLTPRSGILGPATTPEAMRKRLLEPRRNDESGLGSILIDKPYIKKMTCLMIDPFKKKKCIEAFNYAYQNLNGTGNTYHLGNGWIVDLLTSEISAAGGFKLAQRMLKRIKNKNLSKANIITDAHISFAKQGVSREKTDELAEKFLLMSLVHGQISWQSYRVDGLIQPFNDLTMTAAFMVSMASATLDTLTQLGTPGRNIYTTAHNFKNICDNGKAYHFLVPWFIAKRLQEQGYSKKTSAKIPLMFEWAYQSFSSSRGRSILNNTNEKYSSLRNQSHRVDLLQSAMAVLHATNSIDKKKSYDMVTAFRKTQNSVPLLYRRAFKLKHTRGLNFLRAVNISSKRLNTNKILRKIKRSKY